MSRAMTDHRELARRGREYYERVLRAKIEPEHTGKFLALEVETGDYELGDTQLEALDRAEAKHPDSVFYILRVGYPAAARLRVCCSGRPALGHGHAACTATV